MDVSQKLPGDIDVRSYAFQTVKDAKDFGVTDTQITQRAWKIFHAHNQIHILLLPGENKKEQEIVNLFLKNVESHENNE